MAVKKPQTEKKDKIDERLAVWKQAAELVKPIIDQHGLEQYETGVGVFNQTTTLTPVDQYIDHILRIANWLLDEQS